MQIDEKARIAAADAIWNEFLYHADTVACGDRFQTPDAAMARRISDIAIAAYLSALGEQKPVAATYVAGISPEARAALNAIDDNIRQAAIASSTTFVGGENPGLAGAKPVVCATEGCDSPADTHFIRGGVGSYYCASCYLKVQAIPHHPAAAPRAALKAAGGRG